MKFLIREKLFVFAAVSLAAALSLPVHCWAQASFQGLGDLPGGSIYSSPTGVSVDRITVVGESESSLGTEAFRWTLGGGMQGLGDLPAGVFGICKFCRYEQSCVFRLKQLERINLGNHRLLMKESTTRKFT